MLKKEKKKTQDALQNSSLEKSDTRPPQNSPFIAGSPAVPRTPFSSAPSHAQDLSICRHRSSLLHKKTGGTTTFPVLLIIRDGFPHHTCRLNCAEMKVLMMCWLEWFFQVKYLFSDFRSELERMESIVAALDVV